MRQCRPGNSLKACLVPPATSLKSRIFNTVRTLPASSAFLFIYDWAHFPACPPRPLLGANCTTLTTSLVCRDIFYRHICCEASAHHVIQNNYAPFLCFTACGLPYDTTFLASILCCFTIVCEHAVAFIYGCEHESCGSCEWYAWGDQMLVA